MTAPQWQDRPSNQVGAVTTSWCAAGEHGCIRRIRNALDNATSYELYRWLLGDSWKPLEARSTWMSGVPVTPAGCVPMFANVVSPIPFRDGTNLSCRARGCRDGVIVTTNTKQVGSYPTSCILNRMPRGQQWSVQCDGVEVAKGGRIDERTVAKIIAACSKPPKPTVGEYIIKAAPAAAAVDESQNMAIG